jgi:cytochrome c oxidase assembly protein subunit 15
VTPSALLTVALFVVGPVAVLGLARLVRPIELALGFAGIAAIWAFGYVAMTAPGLAAGEVLFAAMLVAVAAAGFVAGRHGASPIRTGLVIATANLLVLGAFLRDEKGGSQTTPLLYVGGMFLGCTALALVGGLLGRRSPASRPLPAANALFPAVASIIAFIMLITGGLVTGLESGLAVPDWPNSFGHNMLLYPISEMKGGIYWEHAHRLFGMLVGTTALVLLSVTWRTDPRPLARTLAIGILVMVCIQGLMGGLRVTGNLTLSQDAADLAPSLALAIAHGVFGQLVLAALLVMAAMGTERWRNGPAPAVTAAAATDWMLTAAVPVGLLLQLVLGALYRHLQPVGGTGVSDPNHPLWAIYLHIGFAVVVTALVLATGMRAMASGLGRPVWLFGHLILIVVAVQVLLGILAVVAVWTRGGERIPAFEVAITTAHQATGAVLLGLSVLLAAWTRRLVVPETRAAAPITRPTAPA